MLLVVSVRLGYLGPNAAEKTTTIRCLLGMERASARRAEIFGMDAQAHPAEAHRRVSYVPGEANLWTRLTDIPVEGQTTVRRQREGGHAASAGRRLLAHAGQARVRWAGQEGEPDEPDRA